MSRAPIHTRCQECGAPIQQAAKGRWRRFCSDACRKTAQRARAASWTWLEQNDPQRARLSDEVWAAEHGDAAAGAPSPDESTVEDVVETIVAAVAVCAQFRRHSVAAQPALAVRCEGVASALDAALAERFGDVLQKPDGRFPP